MARFILYDLATGRLQGRITTNAENDLPENRIDVGEELTEQEWNLRPEMFFKVDIESKKLIDLDDTELRSAHGLKPDVILPTRPDMKARGRE